MMLYLAHVAYNTQDFASTKASDTLSSLYRTLRIEIASDSFTSNKRFCFCSVMYETACSLFLRENATISQNKRQVILTSGF